MLLEEKTAAGQPQYFLQTLKAKVWSTLKNQLLLASLVIIVGLVVFYRDIVFGGHTFLMENTTYGTMPPSTNSPLGPYGYPGNNPNAVNTVLDPGAIAWEGEPVSRVISKILSSWEIPLWNPYTALGEPFLGDGVSAPLDPVQVLFYWVPQSLWPIAMDLQVFLRFFIGAIFTYLFVRLIGLSFGPAVFAALSFPLSTYFVAFGNHPQMRPEMLIPAVLYANERLVRFRNRFAVVIYALIFAWVFYSGMIEPDFLGLALGGLWYLYRAVWQTVAARFDLRLVRQVILCSVGANVLGAALAAPTILLLLENINQSVHVHDASGDSGTISMSFVGAVLALVPNFLTGFGQYFYFFTVVVILALVGALGWFRLGPAGQAGGFFTVFALVFWLKEYGFPLFTWIGELPFYNQIVLLKYITPSVSLSLAILAAIGIEFLTSNLTRQRLALLGTAALTVVFLALLLLGNAQHLLAGVNLDKLIGQLIFVAGIALVIVLAALLFLGLLRQPRFFAISVVLLAVLEPSLINASVDRPVRYDPYTVPPFVDFLHKQPGTFRFSSQDAILYPNVAQAYGLESIFYVEPLIAKRRFLYFGRFIAPNRLAFLDDTSNVTLTADDVDRMTRVTGTELPFYTNSKYFDLLNVQYFLTSKNVLLNNFSPLFASTAAVNAFNAVSGIKVTELSVQNDNRPALLMPPAANVSVPLMLPAGHPQLKFALGTNPKTWTLPGDGTDYLLTVTDKNGRKEVFNHYLNPKQNVAEQNWTDELVDLSNWNGQQVTLTFATDGGPAGDTRNDQPYWANPIIYLPDESSAWSKPAQQSANEVYLMDEFLAQNASKQSTTFRETLLRIGAEKRTALFMHPVNQAELTLALPNNPAKFDFGIGMDPRVWTGQITGDGVQFDITIKTSDNPTPVSIYNRYIDPKHNSAEQRWIDDEVDLSRWKDQTVTLAFSTTGGPVGDNSADWAYWSEFKLAGLGVGTNVQAPHYVTIYDKEIGISRNNYAYPRAFVVYQVAKAEDMYSAADALSKPEFDPSRQAVVEGLSSDQAKTLADTGSLPAPSPAQISTRTANTVTVKTTLDKPGVLVLSESYAPGWVAYIDGKASPVLPADLALRGVYLEAGAHEVKFVYEPSSFKIGLILCLVGLLGLFLILFGPVLFKRLPDLAQRFRLIQRKRNPSPAQSGPVGTDLKTVPSESDQPEPVLKTLPKPKQEPL